MWIRYNTRLRKPAAVLPTREAEQVESRCHAWLEIISRLYSMNAGCRFMLRHVLTWKTWIWRTEPLYQHCRRFSENVWRKEIKATRIRVRSCKFRVCLCDVLSVCFEITANYFRLFSQNLLDEMYLRLLLYLWFCIIVKLGLSLW
jgi:hypothetical protein